MSESTPLGVSPPGAILSVRSCAPSWSAGSSVRSLAGLRQQAVRSISSGAPLEAATVSICQRRRMLQHRDFAILPSLDMERNDADCRAPVKRGHRGRPERHACDAHGAWSVRLAVRNGRHVRSASRNSRSPACRCETPTLLASDYRAGVASPPHRVGRSRRPPSMWRTMKSIPRTLLAMFTERKHADARRCKRPAAIERPKVIPGA